MNFAIIVSRKDIAGMNIKESLLSLFDFKKTETEFEYDNVYEFENMRLYTLNDDTVHAEDIDKKINADFFIFATRHSAQAGVKTLSLHTPGNWDNAEMGGMNRRLCIASPFYLKEGFKLLEKNNNIDFDVTLEVTHHGPYLDKPCMFIEIGSGEQEWKNKDAANVIAKTIIELVSKEKKNYVNVIGIGGTHYGTNFNKIMSRTEIAVSHICPKYMLEVLSTVMIKQAIDRTDGKIDYILLDWKGLGQEKQRIGEMVESMDIHYKKVRDFLK